MQVIAVKIGEQQFKVIMGSDVQRDGMYLELSLEGGSDLAEVFYSDTTHTFSLTLFEPAVPLEAVEWLISEARRRLPQIPGATL